MIQAHDPGGKVRLRLADGVQAAASFSRCGQYRRELSRRVKTDSSRPGFILWVGMNPSTADAHVDDPTCRREWNFTRDWGYAHYVKVNLGDYRATNPKYLPRDGSAISPMNLPTICRLAKTAERVIVAHGNPPTPLRQAAKYLHNMLLESPVSDRIYCFGLTDDGWPRHSLYIPKTAVPSGYIGVSLPWR